MQPDILSDIKSSLFSSFLQSSLRGLLYSASWAIELANSIDAQSVDVNMQPTQSSQSAHFAAEHMVYCMAKSFYDLREFRRSAHALRDCKSDEAFFLRNYCLYLAGEKDKEDNTIDALGPNEMVGMKNVELHDLKRRLAERETRQELDGYGYYLYGVVLKELSDKNGARKMLQRSLALTPMLWSAWSELAKLTEDRKMLYSSDVPVHWLRDFFYAEAALELRLMQDALSYYNNLSLMGFSNSTYINSQLAVVHFHLKNYPESSATFSLVRNLDPFLTTNMDVFSDVLFVLDRLPELSRLAQDLVRIDRYMPVSCCVLGNFYSQRGNHNMAIVYFQRAVRLDKNNPSAWILLGHEFLELKNSSMAIEAYTKGLGINRHDFRGYYGLGNAYNTMRMPFFAVHYFQQAHTLRPADPAILCAMGGCYAELNLNDEAKKCLKRAVAFKDQEGAALVKLAKLYAKLEEDDDAAKLYNRFVAMAESSEMGVHLPKEQGPAHIYLATYYSRKGCYREAEAHAHKSTEFVATREEGKSLLHEIINKKSALDSTGQQVEDNLGSLSEIELSPIPNSSDATSIG